MLSIIYFFFTFIIYRSRTNEDLISCVLRKKKIICILSIVVIIVYLIGILLSSFMIPEISERTELNSYKISRYLNTDPENLIHDEIQVNEEKYSVHINVSDGWLKWLSYYHDFDSVDIGSKIMTDYQEINVSNFQNNYSLVFYSNTTFNNTFDFGGTKKSMKVFKVKDIFYDYNLTEVGNDTYKLFFRLRNPENASLMMNFRLKLRESNYGSELQNCTINSYDSNPHAPLNLDIDEGNDYRNTINVYCNFYEKEPNNITVNATLSCDKLQ